MAALKKRVLAELNQTQVITVEPPVKRLKTLRLLASGSGKNGQSTKTSSILALVECLEKCKSGNDALQLLVRISDTIGQMTPEDVPTVVKKLVERFAIEKEPAVRAKIFWVFAELGELTNDPLEKSRIVTETVNLFKEEQSHRVISQGLATLLKLGEYNKSLVLKTAREHLTDTWHGVQTRCLSIIGRYLSANASNEILELVNNYAKSQDSRVRAQAFETMAELHVHRSCRLPASFLTEACEALADDYEIVRRAVLKLIWLLGNEYPEKLITSTELEEVRMVDYSFSKICSLLGDLSPRVRASALSLLGSLKGVSKRYIEQALDKKPKTVEDEGTTAVEERSGSCGAFVHGLEDEFLEVRSAALESLCLLSVEQPALANHALEFMVDMFNDEIQDIRLKAIESMKKILSSVQLGEDQLETILGALEDCSGEVREGLHSMLAASRLATKNCLNMSIMKLLDNLTRYPEDKDSIRSCLASLGASHPNFTSPLVPQLLVQHPFFDTPEPNIAVPSYSSILVLIFNAAAHCPSMHALFTRHSLAKHYHYLRDTMPHLVPILSPAMFSGSCCETRVVESEQLKTKRANDFLERLVTAIENSRPGSRVYTQLLESAASDLDSLAEMDRRMEGVARFTALYVRCLLLLQSIVKEFAALISVTVSNFSPSIVGKINLLHQNSQKLLRLFKGVGQNEIALAQDIWLKSLALDLIRATKSSTGSALPLARQFLLESDSLPQDCTKLPPFSKALVNQLPTLTEAKPGSLTRLLLPLFLNSPVKGEEKLPRPSPATKFCEAIIEAPTNESEAALKFTGGLILGVPLVAKIFNLKDAGIVRIKLRHPDQQVQLILPRKSDLKLQNTESDEYRLKTTVLISHQVWMEACYIDISIVLLVSPTAGACNHPPLDDPCVIELCKPTRIAVAPKPVKRGI